jgi:hypothetical protein
MAQLCFSAETDPFSRSMMTYGLAASAFWCLPHISDQSQTDAQLRFGRCRSASRMISAAIIL